MTNTERAMRWAKIAERLYGIETTTDSFRKEWLARHYRYFASEMCIMHCERSIREITRLTMEGWQPSETL